MALRRGGLRLLTAAVLAVLCASAPEGAARQGRTAAEETRAMWGLRTSLTSPASITALVRAAKQHGFNTLFVQVRGRGDAYYRGGLEPMAPDLARQPAAFDPLAAVIEAAHGQNIRV